MVLYVSKIFQSSPTREPVFHLHSLSVRVLYQSLNPLRHKALRVFILGDVLSGLSNYYTPLTPSPNLSCYLSTKYYLPLTLSHLVHKALKKYPSIHHLSQSLYDLF